MTRDAAIAQVQAIARAYPSIASWAAAAGITPTAAYSRWYRAGIRARDVFQAERVLVARALTVRFSVATAAAYMGFSSPQAFYRSERRVRDRRRAV